MSNWSYVHAAYALTWGVVAGYAIYLWSRGRKARGSLHGTNSEVEQ